MLRLKVSCFIARSLTHNYDATNRLVSVTGSINAAIGYDANGNVILRAGQGFVFDIGNRMSAATGLASHVYDGNGRRSWTQFTSGRTVLRVYGQAGRLLLTVDSQKGTTRHIHLGDKVVAENNTLTATRWLHADVLGSPVARTGPLPTVGLERTRYEPYGQTAAGVNPDGIGFTGHVNDPETGLVYMQQRYQDPIAGRFLSVDPVQAHTRSGGSHFNRYVYAENNPYKYADPDGQAPHIAIGAVIGGMAGAIGAMRAPDASIGKIALAAAGGAISGAIAAAAPVTGFAMIKGFAAGATGNVFGQLVASAGQAPSLSQAVAQGAVGAIGGGAGQAAAAYTGIGLVSATSQGVGTTVATAVSAAINVVMPIDAGGMKVPASPPPASPPPKTPDK